MINMHDNKVYRKILEHRNNCPKWTKEFCMDCFGGGLTRFLSNMEEEKLKVDKRFTNVKDAVEYMSKNKNKVIIIDECNWVSENRFRKSDFSASVMKYLGKDKHADMMKRLKETQSEK